jgi:hypothetical protein
MKLSWSELMLISRDKKVKGEEKTQDQIINELRQRVAELEKSETQYERDAEKLPATNDEPSVTTENLPEKIFCKDGNSVYVSCNESYAHNLKTKPEEIKAYLEFFSYEAK